MLIYLYQDHSNEEATSIWGPNQDNICNDGTNTNVDCNEEKYVFCSIKSKFTMKYFNFVEKFSINLLISLVCTPDEILVVDTCG